MINFFKNKINNVNQIKYELIELSKKNGEHFATFKLINSPRSNFSYKVSDLTTKHRDILAQLSLDDIIAVTSLLSEKDNILVEYHKVNSFKFLPVFCMLFVTALIAANIASSKLISLYGFTMSGGVFIFPISFIIGDIVTEVYGFKRARQLIWFSIICFIVTLIMIGFVIKLPPSEFWHNQAQYELILGAVPRIIIASLVSYMFGEFTNSYILAKLKLYSVNSDNLALRLIISSITGIIIDTGLFITIAYLWVIPIQDIYTLMIRQFLLKSLIELGCIPVTLKIINLIKDKEHLDIIDVKTKFNIFSMDVDYKQENNRYNKI